VLNLKETEKMLTPRKEYPIYIGNMPTIALETKGRAAPKVLGTNEYYEECSKYLIIDTQISKQPIIYYKTVNTLLIPMIVSTYVRLT
jgi:hypothetical protein